MPDERTPLLQQFPGQSGSNFEVLGDQHEQFCRLVGLPPFTQPPGQKFKSHPESLYYRATHHRRNQGATYMFTATLTNSLLLSQVVLGAALTGLGASDSSRVLITIFGAMNTVIAGLIAFLKSRGQPVRARMFRDDLDRVVDEIENSAVMWLGISRGAHGYDAIDTDDQVTVRSEVARLTRLYDRAVKINSMNDPDNYAAGQPGDQYNAGLRTGPRPPGQPALPVPPAPAAAPNGAPVSAPPPVPAIQAPLDDPDEAPASKAPEPPKPKDDEAAKDDGKAKGDNKAKDGGKGKDDDKTKEDEAPKPDSKVKEEAKDATPSASGALKSDNAAPEAESKSAESKEPALANKSVPEGLPSDATAAGRALPPPEEEPAAASTLPEKHSEDTSHDGQDKKDD